MLCFRLNGSIITLNEDEVRAHDTALSLFREKLHHCGTKEGCASGDCGACTIAVRSGKSDSSFGSAFHSVNACIMPAGQLQGLDVVTAEGLAEGETLHPVQQAMVRHHASQCGFCTPGFVMSLFSLYHSPNSNDENGERATLSDHDIATALGGNLCRCTGYRPIRAAALAMHQTPGYIHDWIKEKWSDDSLKPKSSDNGQSAINFHRPTSLDDLYTCIKYHPDARFVAGGTDLMLESTQRLVDFSTLIDITQVPELSICEQKEGYWEIGAAKTYAQLQPLLDRDYPAFGKLLERLGSQQVRNQGTLGGNIGNASPIGDTPPVLLALDAQLDLNHAGTRRRVDLDKFFIAYRETILAPGEFIQTIILPKLKPEEHLFVWKISKRQDDDISAVLVAIKLKLKNKIASDVRIALGGMAAIPKRAYEAERVLEGQYLDHTIISAARNALSTEFMPLSDARASSDYRLMVAGNLLERLRFMLDDNTIAAELV